MGLTTDDYISTAIPGNFAKVSEQTSSVDDNMASKNETLITSGAIFRAYESLALGVYIYPIMVLITFIVVGLIGNSLVLYVFTFKWKRTKTIVFIISLAALDITNCSIIMPIEVYILSKPLSFDFPNFCKVARCLSYIVTAAYSFVLVAVAYDRYLMVCKPLKRMTLERKYATRTCVGAIFLAIMTQWPSSFLYGTFTYKLPVNNSTLMSTVANTTDTSNDVFVYGTTCLVTNYYYYVNRLPTLLFQGFLFFGHVIIFITLAVVYIVIGRKLFISSHVDITDNVAKQGLLKASIVSALTGHTLPGIRSTGAKKSDRGKCMQFRPTKKTRGNVKNSENRLASVNQVLAKSLSALSTIGIKETCYRTIEPGDRYSATSSIYTTSGQVDSMHERKHSTGSLSDSSHCSSHGMSRSLSLDMIKLHSIGDRRSHHPSGDIKELSLKRNTMIMRMVTFTFILSYLPFLVLVTLRYSDDSVPSKLGTKAKIVYHVFLRSYFLNSVIRPFIYMVMNKQYRSTVLAIIRSWCKK